VNRFAVALRRRLPFALSNAIDIVVGL